MSARDLAMQMMLGFIDRMDMSDEDKIVEIISIQIHDELFLDAIDNYIDILLKAREEICNVKKDKKIKTYHKIPNDTYRS